MYIKLGKNVPLYTRIHGSSWKHVLIYTLYIQTTPYGSYILNNFSVLDVYFYVKHCTPGHMGYGVEKLESLLHKDACILMANCTLAVLANNKLKKIPTYSNVKSAIVYYGESPNRRVAAT